jgi:hypothetical protein
MAMKLASSLALVAVLAAGCATSEAQQSPGATASEDQISIAPSPSPALSRSSEDPSSSQECSGFGISVALGAKGASTPEGALLAWLRTDPEGLNHDPKAWHATRAGKRYSAGKDRAVVSHIPSPGYGYMVTEGSTCGGT